MTKERLSDALVWLSLASVFGSFIPEIVSGSPVTQVCKHLWACAYVFCIVLNRLFIGRFRVVPCVK